MKTPTQDPTKSTLFSDSDVGGKIFICTDPDGYGDTSKEDIEIVQDRIKAIAKDLKIEWELMQQGSLADPDEEHELASRICELAMECSVLDDKDSSDLKMAVQSAISKYPFIDCFGDNEKITKALELLRDLECEDTTDWEDYKASYDDEDQASECFEILLGEVFSDLVEPAGKILGITIRFPSDYNLGGHPEKEWVGYLVNEAICVTADRLENEGIADITLY